MGSTTGKVADFVAGAEYNSIPEEVVHETKRVLLDSIGCAVGGLSMDMGRIAVELARRLGGPCESTILGTGEKVSCANAAFANGQLICAKDYDAGAAGHDTPVVIAASLALVESVQASGEDLISAVALGYEIATRLIRAGASYMTVTREGLEKDDNTIKVAFTNCTGFGGFTIAAAASAGKILNLNREEMANAIGIAGYVCPPSIGRKFFAVSPVRMTKYGVFGWGAQAGVTSALLASMGFTGDTDVFDGEDCFWKYTGNDYWQAERMAEELGRKWLHRINYKQYPANFPTAGAIDCFIQIVEENDIQPEDVQKITARVWAMPRYRHLREIELKTPEDCCFSLPYNLACAAYRINPAHWLDPDVRQDPKLRKFMHGVEFDLGCDEKEFGLARLKDPQAGSTSVEVLARGKTFKKQSRYRKGMWRPEEFRNTDEELIEKFMGNVSRVLPLDKANRVVRTVFGLENLGNAAELMEIVAP